MLFKIKFSKHKFLFFKKIFFKNLKLQQNKISVFLGNLSVFN
jgi:hypothetical protein